MLNIIFCLAIVAVAIWIGLKEKKFTSNYYVNDLSIAQKSVEKLKEYKNNNKNNMIQNQENPEILRWLAQHIKGELTRLAFKPEQAQNNDFILLSYPSCLGTSVPRSPVTFAPALLTSIGILGTFTGIFLGLQGVDLGNLSETQQLILASQKLLEGMKTAFVTSLFGMGSAIFFYFLFILGRKTTYKKTQ